MLFRKSHARPGKRTLHDGGGLPHEIRHAGITFCPGCRSVDVYPSHRRGWLEHGPLTWFAVLPFRCGACQTRFYRLALRDSRRRRTVDIVSSADRSRAPRWYFHGFATVTTAQQGKPLILSGETENIGFFGVRVRIRQSLPVPTKVRVSIDGQSEQEGVIRWCKPHAVTGYWHGIEFRSRFRGSRGHTRPYVVMRVRVWGRRLVFAAFFLLLMAAAAAGLMRVMDVFRNYNSQYYEPKDIERQIYQEQQQQQAPRATPPR